MVRSRIPTIISDIYEREGGWFIRLVGTNISFYAGVEKPEFEVGDKVKITIEKHEKT